MTRHFPFPTLVIFLCVALTVSACAGRSTPVTPYRVHRVQPPPASISRTPAPPAQPVQDVVADLIATSTRHFEAGQRELQRGESAAAKASFNKALETLLDSPTGARGEPRIREQFDSLVERISAYEAAMLGQREVFAETKPEPAAIDQLDAALALVDAAGSQLNAGAVVPDAEAASYDIDIPLNERVLAFVELFSGRLKAFLEDGLGRAVRYLPMIQDVFRAEGLPLDLAYVPLIESAFKPTAQSRAKARGIWQFMSGTGRENGLQQDWYVDERAEPEKATRAAAKYLKTLYATFGDWHLALASYNGGPGRVQRALNRSGHEDFWDVSASSGFLPRETRDYVPLILAAVIVAKNPAQYGLRIAPLEAPPTETIVVPRPTDLRRIAEWADTSVAELQALNPELRRWTTPVRATDYQLRVPAGSADRVLVQLIEDEGTDRVSLNSYTVKTGETLQGIARKLNVSRTDLAEANYLSQKARVARGQQLIVPRPPTTPAARAGSPTASVSDAESVRATVAPASRSTVPSPTVYHVKEGDTLFGIARQFDVSVSSIASWNGLRGTAIQVGQRIKLHSPVANGTR